MYSLETNDRLLCCKTCKICRETILITESEVTVSTCHEVKRERIKRESRLDNDWVRYTSEAAPIYVQVCIVIPSYINEDARKRNKMSKINE